MASKCARVACHLLSLCFSALARAQAPAPELVAWTCWLGDGNAPHIHCLQETDPVLEDAPASAPTPFDDRAMRGSFFAAGKPHNVTRLVREGMANYDNVLWSIPLYAIPFNSEDVKLLAAAVICGNDAHCTVTMAPTTSAFRSGDFISTLPALPSQR